MPEPKQERTNPEPALYRLPCFLFPPYKQDQIEIKAELQKWITTVKWVYYSIEIGVIIGCIYFLYKWSKGVSRIIHGGEGNEDDCVDWVPEPPKQVNLGPVEVVYPHPVADVNIEPTPDSASNRGSSPTRDRGSSLRPNPAPAPARAQSRGQTAVQTRARTPTQGPAAVAKIPTSPRGSSGARRRPPRWV